jgi:ATP-dependent helicase/DNAse subunit B
VKPKLWELPRPEDVQLPLYACFAVNQIAEPDNHNSKTSETIGGLVFAKIRAKDQKFAGNVRNVVETLFASLKNTDSLKKNPLTTEMLHDWRDAIEQLAHEFVLGRAEVDPRDPSKTCQGCELKVLCRVQESFVLSEDDSDDDEGVSNESK